MLPWFAASFTRRYSRFAALTLCQALSLGAQTVSRIGSPFGGRKLRAGVDTTYMTTRSLWGTDTAARSIQSFTRTHSGVRPLPVQAYDWRDKKGSIVSDSVTMDGITMRPVAEVRHYDTATVRE